MGLWQTHHKYYPGAKDTDNGHPLGVCPCLSVSSVACRAGQVRTCPPLVRVCPLLLGVLEQDYMLSADQNELPVQ